MELIEILFGKEDLLQAVVPLIAIALAAAAAGAIGSGIARNKEKKKLKEMRGYIASDKAENKAWYNANYMSDYTQRADAQNLFKHLRDNLKRHRNVTAATAAITGATPAAQAAAKEADVRAIGDTYSNVASLGQRWKDNVTNQYYRRKDMLDRRMLGIDEADLRGYERSAQSWGNLMSTGLNSAAGAASSYYSDMYSSGGGKKAGGITRSQAVNKPLWDAVNAEEAARKWRNY